MKLALIKPYWQYPYNEAEYTYNRIWPPLCLANCAAILEKDGHEVTILDAHLKRIKPHRIKDYVKGYDKVFVTSSTLDRWQCPNTDINTFLETVRFVRMVTGEVYLMGYHGTISPLGILNRTGARAIIRGEPEYTVAEICKGRDLSRIKGLCFKDSGQFISNPERELADLKTLPVPAYHLLEMERYYYEILGRNFLLFEISRGCKYNCKFCNKVMYGKELRAKSEAQIIEEVQTAVEKYNVRTGYFIDLDFLSSRGTVVKLCEFLIRKKYRFIWTCQTRPEFFEVGMLKKMKEAGCRLIHVGVESGMQDSLNSFNKNVTVEQIKTSINLCRRIGLKTLAFVLIGTSGETDRDRERNFEFIKDLNTDFISLHKIVPYEGANILQDDLEGTMDLNSFIRNSMLRYYLRFSYLSKLDTFVFLRGFKLFCGRLRTLR